MACLLWCFSQVEPSRETFCPHCSKTLSLLLFDALLIGIRESGAGCRTVFGLQSASLGFADDLAVSTATLAWVQKILDVIARF